MAAAKNAGASVRVVSCVMKESYGTISWIQKALILSTHIAERIGICVYSRHITNDLHRRSDEHHGRVLFESPCPYPLYQHNGHENDKDCGKGSIDGYVWSVAPV